MPCIKVPTPSIPDLPSPFSVPELTIPPIGSDEITLCCKLPPIKTPPIPIPFSATLLLTPGLPAALSAAISAVTKYINALPLKCPVE